jgi:pimeloyl-ACP methyl ester carboxylesterase
MRGFGWSEAPARGYATVDRVNDVLAVLDALALPRVRLIGHGWGAWTGFFACLQDPQRFSHFLAANMVQQTSPSTSRPAGSRTGPAGEQLNWQYVIHDIPHLVTGRFHLQRLQVPTILLAGERDVVVTPSMLRGGTDQADHLTIQVVPAAGHLLPEEAPTTLAATATRLFST